MNGIMYGATTILDDGTKVTFQVNERDQPRWVAGPVLSNGRRLPGGMSSSRTDFTKKPRMFVDCKGETVLDNLMNRTTRPVNVWGKLIRKAMKQLELDGKIGWYAKAGCSCPCSPGFIWTDAPKFLTTGEHAYDSNRYDVWVSIEGAPIVRDDAAAQLEQLGRLGALANDPTLPLEALAGTRL